MPGSTGGQHWASSLADRTEIYGAHLIRGFLEQATPFASVLDVGAGDGRDLGIAHEVQPDAALHAVTMRHSDPLLELVPHPIYLDVERAPLPFPDESLDLVIANQVLEHTKEIFWIIHEMTHVLKVGGHLLLGVPNVASAHNRALMMFGRHPTQHKLYAAHVRVFSRRDTERFFDVCWPGGYEVGAFGGSQFYPFPVRVARPLATLFPAAAVCIFWLLTKKQPYDGEFLRHPVEAQLDTPFYLGDTSRPG